MIIALASPRVASTHDEGLDKIRHRASKNRRPASSPRRAGARRPCPMGRRECWCIDVEEGPAGAARRRSRAR